MKRPTHFSSPNPASPAAGPWRRIHGRLRLFVAISAFAPLWLDNAFLPSAVQAAQEAGYTPKSTEFLPLEKGAFYSGELALVDPINRRAAIRLDCPIRDAKRASEAPLFYIAMLPCGELWFHGAPATFQDIPLGTHVQGYFYPPPAGQEETIAPPPQSLAALIPKENHALLLEDDVSFAKRHKFHWKIVSVAKDTSKLTVKIVGETPLHGPSDTQILDFDPATRVWKGGRLVSFDQVTPNQIVRLNFARAINWTDNEFGTNDIWLDEESLAVAADTQDKTNTRYHRIRWLPGRIETIEEFDHGGGMVTLVLFGGVSKQLISDLYNDRNERIAVTPAEPTLRTWTHRGDRVFGKMQHWENSNAVPGFSGVRLRLKFAEILEHFRPGNAVRVKAESWLFISNTPEERIQSFEHRDNARLLRLPEQSPAPGTPMQNK